MITDLKKPLDEPIPSPEDVQFMHLVRPDFEKLKWEQKLALKYVYQRPKISEIELLAYLHERSFCEANVIIRAVRDSGLVEIDSDKTLSPHPAKYKIVGQLFRERSLC